MLTLICGRPRSGKTTYSQRYDCTVLHADYLQTWGVVRKIKELPEDADVVVDGVYRHEEERLILLSAYKGSRKTCIWLDTPEEIRATRHGYHRFQNQPFDEPTLAEGWDTVMINRNGEIEYYTKDGDADDHEAAEA